MSMTPEERAKRCFRVDLCEHTSTPSVDMCRPCLEAEVAAEIRRGVEAANAKWVGALSKHIGVEVVLANDDVEEAVRVLADYVMRMEDVDTSKWIVERGQVNAAVEARDADWRQAFGLPHDNKSLGPRGAASYLLEVWQKERERAVEAERERWMALSEPYCNCGCCIEALALKKGAAAIREGKP